MHERKDAFLFVNIRLEGNAPSTIEAVVEKLDAWSAETSGPIDTARRQPFRYSDPPQSPARMAGIA